MGADLTSHRTERWHRLGSALLAAAGAACGAVFRQVIHSPGSIEWSWRPLFISVPAGLLLSFVLERAYERRRGGAESSTAPHLGRWQVAATVIAIVIVGLEQVIEEIFAIVVRNKLALVNWLILFVQAGLLTYAWLGAARSRASAGARRGALVGLIAGGVLPVAIRMLLGFDRGPIRIEWVTAIFWGLSGLLGGAAFGLAWKGRVSPAVLGAGVAGGLFAASVLVDVLLAAVPMGVSPGGVVWSLWVPVGWGLGLIVYPPHVPARIKTR